MSNKVFVGGLAWETDNQSLRTAFEKYGQVDDAYVISDRETGRSRGFGFVTFTDAKSAEDAVAGMKDQELDGRPIRVDIANERPARGEGGGGGGYRGGRDSGRGGDRYGDRYGGDRRDDRGSRYSSNRDRRDGGRNYDRDSGRGGDRGDRYGGERRERNHDREERSSGRRDDY